MPALPGARDRLVGRDDHALDARGPVQRRERGDEHHRRAVRARRDALAGRSRRSSGLTSATTSGTSGSMRNAAELSMTFAPGRRGRAAPTRARAGRRRRRSRGRARRSSPSRSTSQATSPPANGELAALRPRRRVRRAAPSTGNARSSRIRSISWPTRPVAPTTPTFTRSLDTHRRFAPSSKAGAARARPARRRPPAPRTRSGSTTCEIISMLTPSRGERPRTSSRRHRGCVFMPAPTSETRPIAGVVGDARSPRSRPTTFSITVERRGAGRRAAR